MTPRPAADPTTLEHVLDRAAALLAGEPDVDTDRTGADGPPADPTGVLVEAGWFMLQQLEIALGMTVGGVEIDRLVPDVLDRAAAFGIASPQAVGAAATLVDRVRGDDPRSLARAILAARGAFGDAEVVAGVVALSAALSVQIALSMGLDSGVVHDELSERAGRVLRCSVRRGDQTWSGRNSQCHGSRGTDSTHPKRGAFTCNQVRRRSSVTSASTARPQPWLDVPGTAAYPPWL